MNWIKVISKGNLLVIILAYDTETFEKCKNSKTGATKNSHAYHWLNSLEKRYSNKKND